MKNLLLLLLIGCIACTNTKTKTSNTADKNYSLEEDIAINGNFENSSMEPFEEVLFMFEEKELPINDNSLYEKYESLDTIDKKYFEALYIEKVAEYFDVSTMYPNYKANLSDNFISLAVIAYDNVNFIYSYLINFDDNFEYIDHLEVAYEEISAGYDIHKAIINANKITLIEIYEDEDSYEETTTEYTITEDGKFQKIE